MAYCTVDDVFANLSAQAFVARGRPVLASDVDGATGVIRLKAHGLTDDDVITFEVTTGGSLPTAVSAFAPYYPTVTAFDLFNVSATPGGAVLAFASVGSGWAVAIDPLRRIRWHMEQEASILDQHLTGHAVPFEVNAITGKHHPVLVGLNARMAARAAVTSLQVENASYRKPIDRLFAAEEFDKQMLGRLSSLAWPLRPDPTADESAPANLAVVGTSNVDSRGWDWTWCSSSGRRETLP